MKTFCYYLNGDYVSTLQEILKTIPCFISYDDDESVIINCREEDAAFVERKLAAFV